MADVEHFPIEFRDRALAHIRVMCACVDLSFTIYQTKHIRIILFTFMMNDMHHRQLVHLHLIARPDSKAVDSVRNNFHAHEPMLLWVVLYINYIYTLHIGIGLAAASATI